MAILESEFVKRVLEMHAAGVPQTEIAKELGTLRQSVWKIIHGIIGNHTQNAISIKA